MKAKGPTPTKRTSELLEAARLQHWGRLDPAFEAVVGPVMLHEVVEWYDHRTRRRHDFAGIIDLLYFDGRLGRADITNVVGAQISTLNMASERRRKIDRAERIHEIEAAGIRIELWLWRKVAAGWKLRIDDRVGRSDGASEWTTIYDGPGWREYRQR